MGSGTPLRLLSLPLLGLSWGPLVLFGLSKDSVSRTRNSNVHYKRRAVSSFLLNLITTRTPFAIFCKTVVCLLSVSAVFAFRVRVVTIFCGGVVFAWRFSCKSLFRVHETSSSCMDFIGVSGRRAIPRAPPVAIWTVDGYALC